MIQSQIQSIEGLLQQFSTGICDFEHPHIKKGSLRNGAEKRLNGLRKNVAE